MSSFELINAERYANSPFSVPCPHCGSVATYQKDETKTYPTHASQVAVDFGGADPDVYGGTVFGKCSCTNQACQEHIYFIGSYITERDDEDFTTYFRKFVIKTFYPPIPLVRIPPATPKTVSALLTRSFAPAFFDQSASGNLLRSTIERLLTAQKVPRFMIAKGRRIRLSLHERILRLPLALQPYKDDLLAIKWIGNVATHDDLSVKTLKLLYEIIESLLDNLYGTKRRDLSRAIRLINRRKRP